MAEKEYIEREALQDKAFGKDHPIFYDGEDRADWYRKCINETPAADVVEVVRCKDCKFRENLDSNYGGYCCEKIRHEIYLDDFCSYGERKENDNAELH